MGQFTRRSITPLLALLSATGAAWGQSGGTTATLTYGHYDLDTAPDRDVASLLLSRAVSDQTRLSLEVVNTSREEDASFASFGLRQDFGGGTALSFNVGVSNSDLGVFPENRLVLGYEYTTPPEQGYVFRSAVEFSDFAMDAESYALRGEAVRYFPPAANGRYLVGQIGGTVVLSEPGSEVGWELSLAGTVVTPQGWSYGLAASTGSIGYEGALSMPVDNDFVAFRPLVSYSLSDNAEIVGRGEIVDSDDYEIRGLSVSVIFDF